MSRVRAWILTVNARALTGGFDERSEEPLSLDDSLSRDSSGSGPWPGSDMTNLALGYSDACQRLLREFSKTTRYTVGQLERGENGNYHLQAFLMFEHPQRLASVVALAPGCHAEPCRLPKQAMEYCQKAESRVDGPWSHGDPPAQGKRSDIDELVSAVQDRRVRTMADAAGVAPSLVLRYPAGVRTYLDAVVSVTPRTEMPVVIYLWGPPGVGKTHYVHEFAKQRDMAIYVVETHDRTYRFTGYTGQSVVLFDEVDFASLPVNEWCRLLDRYPHTVRRFGLPNINFNSRYIFMTSNADPKDFMERHPSVARRVRVVHVPDRDAVSGVDV